MVVVFVVMSIVWHIANILSSGSATKVEDGARAHPLAPRPDTGEGNFCVFFAKAIDTSLCKAHDARMTSTPTELTTREALEVLGLADPSSISRLVAEGHLTPTRKLPGRTGAYLFAATDIARLAAERNAA